MCPSGKAHNATSPKDRQYPENQGDGTGPGQPLGPRRGDPSDLQAPAARAAGVQWRAIYNDYAVAAAVNRHLDRRHVTFVGRASPTYCRRNGPLWVTTDEAPGAPFAIHARIITRIRGDGTPAGTTLSVVDPAGGRAYDENFATFQAKFEEVAIGDMAGGGEPRVETLPGPLLGRIPIRKRILRRGPREAVLRRKWPRAMRNVRCCAAR